MSSALQTDSRNRQLRAAYDSGRPPSLFAKGYEVAVHQEAGHLLVRATDNNDDILYQRRVKNTGLWRYTLPEARAKMYALVDAGLAAFLLTQLSAKGGRWQRLARLGAAAVSSYAPNEPQAPENPSGPKIYRKGYRIMVDEVPVTQPGRTWARRRPTNRDKSYLHVRATTTTTHGYDTVYERKIRHTGWLHSRAFPKLRAKETAQDAEVSAFYASYLASLTGLPILRRSANLPGLIKRAVAPRGRQPRAQRETPTIIDFNEAIARVNKLAADGAPDHIARTIELDMPAGRSALVAGYYHRDKGEGWHQHSQPTVLQVLQGQFRAFAWDGGQWIGGVYGPGAFINMGAYTPHLVEPHSPQNPNALNIIMVETLQTADFGRGQGYNQNLPEGFPEIPHHLLAQATPADRALIGAMR